MRHIIAFLLLAAPVLAQHVTIIPPSRGVQVGGVPALLPTTAFSGLPAGIRVIQTETEQEGIAEMYQGPPKPISYDLVRPIVAAWTVATAPRPTPIPSPDPTPTPDPEEPINRLIDIRTRLREINAEIAAKGTTPRLDAVKARLQGQLSAVQGEVHP